MTRKFFMIQALLLLVGLSAFAQTAADVPYRDGAADGYARQRCRLDIFSPDGAEDLPVVVYFHGGSLTGGDKSKAPKELLKTGFVVVSANYRLLPKEGAPERGTTIDDCIDDAAAAVAWTFRNISDYGGSPDKIFVAGHSAGGYLTDMIGLDKSWLQAYGIDADRIAGLIPFSGQVISHFAYRRTLGMSELQPSIDPYAPLAHIRPDAPPIVIISADRERELYGRYEETAYFWRLLKLVGHPDVSIYELQGFTHSNMLHPAVQILKDNVDRILANPR